MTASSSSTSVPQSIWRRPIAPWFARLSGSVNFLLGLVISSTPSWINFDAFPGFKSGIQANALAFASLGAVQLSRAAKDSNLSWGDLGVYLGLSVPVLLTWWSVAAPDLAAILGVCTVGLTGLLLGLSVWPPLASRPLIKVDSNSKPLLSIPPSVQTGIRMVVVAIPVIAVIVVLVSLSGDSTR